MSGLAGVICATRERNITEAIVRHLTNQIVHRGRTMRGRLWCLLMFELWLPSFLEKYVIPDVLFSLPVVAGSRREAPNTTESASARTGE